MRDREPVPDTRGARLLARAHRFLERVRVLGQPLLAEQVNQLTDHALLVHGLERGLDALGGHDVQKVHTSPL